MPGRTSYTTQQIHDVLAYTDPSRPKPNYDEVAREMQKIYGPTRKGAWKAASIKYIIDSYSIREEYQFFPWQSTYQRSQPNYTQQAVTPHCTSHDQPQNVAGNNELCKNPSRTSNRQHKNKFLSSHLHPPTHTPPHWSRNISPYEIDSYPFHQEDNSMGHGQTTSEAYSSSDLDCVQKDQVVHNRRSVQTINQPDVDHKMQMGSKNQIEERFVPNIMPGHQESETRRQVQQSVAHHQPAHLESSQPPYLRGVSQGVIPKLGNLVGDIHPSEQTPQIPPSEFSTAYQKHYSHQYISAEDKHRGERRRSTQSSQYQNDNITYTAAHSMESKNSSISYTGNSPKYNITPCTHSRQPNGSHNEPNFRGYSPAGVKVSPHSYMHTQEGQESNAKHAPSITPLPERFKLGKHWKNGRIEEALRSAHLAMSHGRAIDPRTCHFVSWIVSILSGIGANNIPGITEQTLQKFRQIADYQRSCSQQALRGDVPCGRSVKDCDLQVAKSLPMNERQHPYQSSLPDCYRGYQPSPSVVNKLQPRLDHDPFPDEHYKSGNFYNHELQRLYQNNLPNQRGNDTGIPLQLWATVNTYMNIPDNIKEPIYKSPVLAHHQRIRPPASVNEPLLRKRKTISHTLDQPNKKSQKSVIVEENISGRFVSDQIHQFSSPTGWEAADNHQLYTSPSLLTVALNAYKANKGFPHQTLTPSRVMDERRLHYNLLPSAEDPNDQNSRTSGSSQPEVGVKLKKRKAEEALAEKRVTKRQERVVALAPGEIIEETAGGRKKQPSAARNIDPVMSTSLELKGIMAASGQITDDSSSLSSQLLVVSSPIRSPLEAVLTPVVISEVYKTTGPSSNATDSVSDSSPAVPVFQSPISIHVPVSERQFEDVEHFLASWKTEKDRLENSGGTGSKEDDEGDDFSTKQITDWSEFNSIVSYTGIERKEKREVYYNAIERYPNGFTLPDGVRRIVNKDGTFGYTTLPPNED